MTLYYRRRAQTPYNTAVSRHSPRGDKFLEYYIVKWFYDIESVEIAGANSVNRGNVR